MTGVVSRAILFLSVWILLLMMLVGVGEHVAPVYGYMTERRALIKTHSSEIQAVSLGSSHAKAIDFTPLGINGFHLSRGGSDLHETAFLAREVLPSLPAVKCMFISVSPHSIHGDNGAAISRDRLGSRRELYSGSTSTAYIEGDRNVFFLSKLAPLLREDHWGGVLAAFVGLRPARVTDNGALEAQKAAPALTGKALNEHGERSARHHEALIEEVLRVKPSAKNGGYYALDALLGDLSASGITVVLYTSPLHHSYLRSTLPLRLQETRAAGENLTQRHENAMYLDFSVAEPFATRSELFQDSNHLTAVGSHEFSSMLAERLRRDPRGASCVDYGVVTPGLVSNAEQPATLQARTR
jgi:hypothetical protein